MSAAHVAQAQERKAIDHDVLQWINELDWEEDEDRFDQLARRIFKFQFECCESYARFCSASGSQPGSIKNWREIPAVPTGAFKEVSLRCFPEQNTKKTFRTSGTSTQHRGELHLDSLTLYEASLWASIKRFVFPDLPKSESMTLRILAPTSEEQPDSSLSHMFGQAMERIGGDNSGYDIVSGELRTRSASSRPRTFIAESATRCALRYGFRFRSPHRRTRSQRGSAADTSGRLPNHGDRRLQGSVPRNAAQ